jgi:hypothetical protein
MSVNIECVAGTFSGTKSHGAKSRVMGGSAIFQEAAWRY